METKFFSAVISVLVSWFCLETKAQTQTTFIRNGTDSSQYLPYYINHAHSVNEMIYLQSQIQQAGFITRIGFFKARGVDIPIDNVTIYLKTTQDTALSFGVLDTTGFTRVFSGEIPMSTTYRGWREIVLDNSFYYNNTANLQIIFRRNWSTNNAFQGNIPFYTCGLNLNRNASRRFSDNFPLAAAAVLVPEPVLPNLKLEFNTVAAIDEEKPQSDILLSPNPVSNTLTIRGLKTPENIKIKNAIGKEVKFQVLRKENNLWELNLTDLTPGIYFVENISGNKVYRRKFIKL